MTSNCMQRVVLQSFVVLFVLKNVGCSEAINVSWNVGSVLFKKGISVTCFGEYEKSLLAARMELDKLLPNFKESKWNTDKDFLVILQYFRKLQKNIERMPKRINQKIVLTAYYDAIGGYLKSFLVPTAKLSFYAGNTTLATIRRITNLYDECRAALDTKGLGWTDPSEHFYNFKPYVLPLYTSNSGEDCNELILLDEENNDENQLIPLPKLEGDEYSNELTNIWLPFKRKHVYNLRAKQSAFIFVRYFIASKRCHEIEKVSSSDFNKKLERWIMNNVVSHLRDESVYAGFGGALRVLRTLKPNLSEPLFLGHTHMHQFRKEGLSQELNTIVEDDYLPLELPAEKNLTLSTPKPESPLFTSDMMWITIFSVVGVLIVILVLLCMQKFMKRQISSNLSDPKNSNTAQKSNTSHRNRRSTGYLQRKTENHPSSSGTSLNRPIDYINPPSVLSHVDKRKPFLSANNNRQNSFSILPKSTFKQEKLNSASSHSVFNINSDIESEEELIASKDLTAITLKDDRLEPHSVKNSLDVSLKNPKNKEKINLPATDQKPPEKKTFKNFLLGRETPGVANQVLTPAKIKPKSDSKPIIVKNKLKMKLKTFNKQKEVFSEPNRYNFELSEWETIPE